MHSSIRFSFALLLVCVAMLSQCTKDMLDDPTPDSGDMSGMDPDSMSAPIIWTGPEISFTKANGADPGQAANQDRLTDNVWITRGNSGGQIFNIVVESSHNKGASPIGTEWAVGSLADWESLNFLPFRSAVSKPKNVAGKNLVLHLIDDNIYLSVRFTSWAQGQGGGFSYMRSTPP